MPFLMTMPGGPGVEARAPFQCPGMLNCSQICQGFPSRCVNGQCICDRGPPPASTLLAHLNDDHGNDQNTV